MADITKALGLTTHIISYDKKKPDIDYDFISSSSPGITSVRFSGNANLDYVSENYSISDFI